MKSDVINVSSEGSGMNEALLQAEKVAAFKSLNKKDTIHLRLFAEEMMGMMKALTGEHEADFWIEADDNACHLHLLASTPMYMEKREKLLSVSTSGKNDVKGFMAKVKNIFEKTIEIMDNSYSEAVGTGIVEPSGYAAFSGWSLSEYRADFEKDYDEQWDELEHSVVAKLADEVRIRINGKNVEMIIDKTFGTGE